jgi:hypothetical protein
MQVETMPSAYITVSKGRRKIKQDKYVYLNNGQEFEIELFNPTTDNVLTKIWINNKPMSSSGIILRPGERVFLERYIDTPKKFLFDTYEVGGSNASVQKAIEKNGLIKVQFYREDTTPDYNDGIILTSGSGILGGPNQPYTWSTHNVNDTTFTTNTSSLSFSADASTTLGLTDMNVSGTLTRGISDTPKSAPKKRSKKALETGRVEQGSHSSQTFEYTNKKFLSWAFRTVEYQIKPTSTQPKTFKDVLTKYCTGCGKKAKPANKFCSNCGTKL